MKQILSYEGSLGLRRGNMGLLGEASILRLNEATSLNSPLITRGTVFPAGSRVDADVQLDTYRLAYQHDFAFRNPTGTIVTLSPSLGIGVLDFEYRLQSGALDERRSYKVGTPQLGMAFDWNPPGRFSAAAGVASSLPEVSNLFLLSSQFTARYRLWGDATRGGLLFLGVGFDLIDFEDSQSVPNHVRANMGPLLLFGIKAGF